MSEILVWLFFGGLAGWIASLLIETESHGRDQLAGNIVVGMAGALLGGYAIRSLGGAANEVNFTSLMIAVLGSVIFLTIFRTFNKV